jgi:Acetyltransferase (GNAT) domain
MKPVIAPVDREILKSELTEERFARKTNFGNNNIYILNHHNAPNVMMEIGRLREVSFRLGGGGTGEEVDIDENDTCEVPYEQLIVWDIEEEEIVGGYRFIRCDNAVLADGTLNLSTAHLFNYSEEFVKDYVPKTIELGRSWVQPAYQGSADSRKGIFALDNLWDGLGALVVMYPDIEYFFGKVTMYPSYNIEARDLLLAFMQYYFPDKENLVKPINPLKHVHDMTEMKNTFKGLDFTEGFRLLGQKTRLLGENVPPMISSYMKLSLTMRTFGTAVNDWFGDVEETGIMITIKDIYDSKKHRHVDSFLKELAERIGVK